MRGIMTPEQCRAGRALLDWSQDELEAASGIAKKTIADFERGAQFPYRGTMTDLEAALEAGGVELIPENGGGAGVRLRTAVARLVRKRVSRFDRTATIVIAYRGREFQVRFSTDILDDVNRTNLPTEAAMEDAADHLMNKILVRAAAAIDAGREAPRGMVVLNTEDFPETF
jgi:transcriptional regulator with XRE-family HTH domain